MARYDLKAKARDVNEQGYCVLDALFGEEECAEMRTLLDRPCEEAGGFSSEYPQRGFHPLFHWVPDMAPFYGNEIFVDAAAEILQDDARLAHNGCLIISTGLKGPALTDWHHHHNDWELPGAAPDRDHPRRLFFCVYPDGTTADVGHLAVLQRQRNDPVVPLGEVDEDWPDQLPVSMPCGSAILCDTALWYCSRNGTEPGIRRLWGGHLQVWDYDRAHPEDVDAAAAPASRSADVGYDLRKAEVELLSDNAGLEAHAEALPALRGLLEHRPSA